jgi:hypothetical protein
MNHSFDIDHARLYGIPEAIIIHNFSFWINRNRANGTHQHDGHTWLYNSVKALGTLFPYMTGDKIRRALESLEAQGVLLTGFYNARPGDRTKWFAFVDEAEFLPAEDHLAKIPNGGKKAPKDHLAKTPNGGAEGKTDHLAKTPNGLAKTPNAFGENPKSSKQTDITTDVDSDISPAELSSEELFELAWAAYPARPGASRTDSWKKWNARIADGADPQEIIAGVKAYAAYVLAKGTEPEFIKQPATFFGPGNHYAADWTPPAVQQQRKQAFNPMNSGAFDDLAQIGTQPARSYGNAVHGNGVIIDVDARSVDAQA